MRKTISITLAIAFVVLLVSVIGIAAGEERGEREGPPQGERGFFPLELHKLAGGLVLLLGLIHAVYNVRALRHHLGAKSK